MKYNKALGPDGFLAKFYQDFWEVIKRDLMALLKISMKGNCLNFGIITLLPKQK
jgi:hypothetical protein